MAKEKTPQELAGLAAAIGKENEDGTSTGLETAADASGTGSQAASVDEPAKGPAEKPQDGREQLDDTSGANAGDDDGTAAGCDSAGEGGAAVAGEDAGTAEQSCATLSYRDFCEQPLEDMPVIVASGSYQGIFSVCDVIYCKVRDVAEPVTVRPLTSFVAKEMAAYVRKIGRRATADILGQHLQIKKMRPKGELTTPERIALSAFISTLLDLDDFIAFERARLEREAQEVAKPAPVPLEDTIFEPADDFFTPSY